MNATRVKIGTKTRMRYPRTGELKRPSRMIKRANKFESWLIRPLHVGAGRFQRLARELQRKPIRAERQHLRLVARDKAAAEKLGL